MRQWGGRPGAPSGGAKLTLALLVVAALAVWLFAPSFFRGSRSGVCGLSLKYGPELTQVTVQRVDGRDEPRAAAAEKPMAVPCGEALEVRWIGPRPSSSEDAAASRPEASVVGGEERTPRVARSQTIPAARLRERSVVVVELR